MNNSANPVNAAALQDASGRTIDYLRLSVTDRCNLRCCYCMPQEGIALTDHRQILTFEEVVRLCRAFAALGISKIKVTGGEPLVRKGIIQLLDQLRQIPGIKSLTLTTNGVLLPDYAADLAGLGLAGINVSLDTLNPDTYRRLTGVPALAQALEGLDRIIALGLPVKINCVPMRGINEAELPALAALAKTQVQAVRFIELMPIGLGTAFTGVPWPEIRDCLEQAHGPLLPWPHPLGNGPAEYYHAAEFQGQIGVICAVSHGFCQSCNRIRLTADGQLKLCLAHNAGLDLRHLLKTGADDAALQTAILAALATKPDRHGFGEEGALDKNTRAMHAIGG